MKILTVRLPEALVAEIEAESRERRRSKSDVVRERLSRVARPRSRPASPAIADLIGSVDGLPADLSGQKKAHLKRRAMAGSVLVDAGFLIVLLSDRTSR